MRYSHTYQDPETGDLVDVMVAEEPRNAPFRPFPGGIVPRHARPQRPYHPPPGNVRPRPVHRPQSGGIVPDRLYTAHRGPTGRHDAAAPVHGEYLSIKKAAFAELIPAAGQLWASFLGLPDKPKAIGDDIVDRDNALMYSEALATHQQNQTRILALTDLAARAIKVFVG